MQLLSRLSLPTRIGIVAGLCSLGASSLLLMIGLIAVRAANLSGAVYDPASNGYRLDSDAASPVVTQATLVFGIPLVVLLSFGAGCAAWAATRRELGALRSIATTIAQITAQTLRTRVPVPDVKGDVRTAATGVNALLERLDEGFARGSRFASNASHELRTPLAASRTILQVALRGSPPPEVAKSFERLLTLNDRMISTSDALLQLAHAENILSDDDVPLRALVAEAIALLEPEIARRHLRVALQLDDVTIRGNDALIRQLLANLLRNAVVHNIDRGQLRVTINEHKHDHVSVEVSNDGPIIAERDLHGLVEPFRRLNERVSGQGHGLGLAIAHQIIQNQDAAWQFHARPAGGLTVRVIFDATRSVRGARIPDPPATSATGFVLKSD